jgi:hypothetical protein
MRKLESISFDLFVFTLISEATCYYINREKVKLFLEKEKSRMQEEQTTEILENLPMGVLVIDKQQQAVFKNQQLKDVINQVTEAHCERATFNPMKYFIFHDIFRPETTDGAFEDQQVPLISLKNIIASGLQNQAKRFAITLEDETKMVLSIGMQRILLRGIYYVLLLFEN